MHINPSEKQVRKFLIDTSSRLSLASSSVGQKRLATEDKKSYIMRTSRQKNFAYRGVTAEMKKNLRVGQKPLLQKH